MDFQNDTSSFPQPTKKSTISDPDLISDLNISANELYASYPPQYRTKSKLVAYEKVKKEADYNPTQALRLTRWRTMKLPETYDNKAPFKFDYSETVFQYQKRKGDDVFKQIDWHLNFAHSNLFCCYAGSLLAQDELQVLECPILASIREFLVSIKDPTSFQPYTVARGKATPILIANVDRVIDLDTYPDASKDRPRGLYGNEFERASKKAIDLAANILKPPTRVNLIAMEAPPGGYGKYDERMITFILESCYTGFAAAKRESAKVSALLKADQGSEVVKVEKRCEDIDKKEAPVATNIFTGFWGCGAYGGDRQLMVILQIIGARLAGVDSLTIHTVHKEGKKDVEKALKMFDFIMADVKKEIKVSELVNRLVDAGFKWGSSNGT